MKEVQQTEHTNYIPFPALSGSTLKMIACATMLTDHIGAVFFPDQILFRMIGRAAFPIFAFLIAEGYRHTRNIMRYAGRLLLLAVLSEPCFDYLFYEQPVFWGHQNVFFTLALGVLTLYFCDRTWSKSMKVANVVLMMLIAEVLRTDYNSMGILMIVFFFYFYENLWQMWLAVGAQNVLLMGRVQMFGALGLIPISFYNGKRGKDWKLFFYLFYPVHLIVLAVIRSFG